MFRIETEHEAILRPTHNIYGLKLAHLEFLNCDEEYSIQTSQKEIKTYVHCESAKKLPKKNLRTVLTPDNLTGPLNDFPIFITSGVLQIAFTFYPICIVLEK